MHQTNFSKFRRKKIEKLDLLKFSESKVKIVVGQPNTVRLIAVDLDTIFFYTYSEKFRKDIRIFHFNLIENGL